MTPWHPVVVHFPIALTLLVPLVALCVLVAVRLKFLPAHAWLGVIVLQAMVCGTALLATETGEDEENVVEKVVPNEALHEHEERAELFYKLSWVALGLSGLGLIPGRACTPLRIFALLGAVALVPLVIRTGQAGGELVYKHGAAEAYRGR